MLPYIIYVGHKSERKQSEEKSINQNKKNMNDYNFVMNLLEQQCAKRCISEYQQTEITEILHLQYPDLDPEEIADAVFDYFPN